MTDKNIDIRQNIEPVPVEELVDCLRKLMKSVENRGKTGGRQAYLRFTGQFIR